MRGKDTFQYKHPLGSAIGISKKRKADIAWLYTDSANKNALAVQTPLMPVKDSSKLMPYKKYTALKHFSTWKMETAVGGGPVLVQDGQVMICNEQEMKFAGKAINDKHPRTAMGYTKDGFLVILLIQGRFPGLAEGATLEQEARILISLGCVEAINLDGGGSSCMLINGKETIRPSDKEGQRPVPAVFIIK
jgi:exopolysaccharide biosynthesis protein